MSTQHRNGALIMRRRGGLPPYLGSRRKKNRGKHEAEDDDEYVNTPQVVRLRKQMIVCNALEQGLFEKRGSDREEALARMIEALTYRSADEYLENNFATCLYRCLNSFKKGSTMEKQLSLHVIGLLAIIVDCQNKLSEIYNEVLPVLSSALKSGPTTSKILECLSIVAFFGATNSEETERAMQIIWKFINHESGYDANAKKHSEEVLVAAIYAWLFLLSSMDGWRLNHNYWNGAISYFSNLLEHGDKLVHIAASEALALIFETGGLEKFSSEEKTPSRTNYSHLQELLRANTLKKLKCLYLNNISENTANKIREVVKYFESFRCPETRLTVSGKGLKLLSWYQMIQLQFLKRFLAGGFNEYMKEIEKLQNLFEFDPQRNKNVGPQLYVSAHDTLTVSLLVPDERDQENLMKQDIKKERVWRNSLVAKARTKLMSKHRLMSQELNRGDYD